MWEGDQHPLTANAPWFVFLALQTLIRPFCRGSVAECLLVRETWNWVHHDNNMYFFPFLMNAKVFPFSGTLHALFPLSGMTFSGFLALHPSAFSWNVSSMEMRSLFTLYGDVRLSFSVFFISVPHDFPPLAAIIECDYFFYLILCSFLSKFPIGL